ncbi:MAG TPA: helical backbone metal receptor, partial [Planctomycetota bacterium]|nr:helical backbone metal receptor [Planctomycetota bacterium]
MVCDPGVQRRRIGSGTITLPLLRGWSRGFVKRIGYRIERVATVATPQRRARLPLHLLWPQDGAVAHPDHSPPRTPPLRSTAPQRVVSLVPSTTETLVALGAGPRVVGRTRYCVHPRPWVDGVPTVGGTKDPDLGAITALRPDLIVVNEEENRPEQFPALAAIAPLFEAFPRDVDGALADIARLAEVLDVAPAGAALLERLA